jgi:phosphoglycerate dehydrogenase-like enzyme
VRFKLVLMPPEYEPDWPQAIARAVPECVVATYAGESDLADADAVFGTLPPELFAQAPRLRWIAAARAGLGQRWFYDALVESDVVVTGMHGAYNETLSAHALGFVLAFARRLDRYLPQQSEGLWRRDGPMLELPHMTALVVGVGGSGAEVGRLCSAFGMRVLGTDPRVSERPPGFAALHPPSALNALLGETDFVIVTAPETPATLGMFDAGRFARMKQGSWFINISRGALVVTDDLVAALQSGHLAGAGLDVVDPEPLPPEHPLWRQPGVLLTPHAALNGTPYKERWLEMLVENCRRFAAGEPLRNVVDKRSWF